MSVTKSDEYLTCLRCGDEFLFGIREQKYNRERGFKYPPRYCKPCRIQRMVMRRRKPVELNIPMEDEI